MLSFYLSILESQEDCDKIINIYNEQYSFMAYTARKYVKNEKDIEDIIHDCMLKIIECIDKLDFSVYEKTRKFCSIIVRNKAIDFCRSKENSKYSFEETFYETDSEEDSPLKVVVDNDSYDIIRKEIESMSDTYRDVCILKFVFELKDKEIATLLGIPASVVGMRISRGRKILRDKIRKENLYEWSEV